jgi:hypothetical protein
MVQERSAKVTVLIDDRDIRVLDPDTGTLIRKLVLDPTATTNHAARDVDVVHDDEDRAVDLHVDADLLTG